MVHDERMVEIWYEDESGERAIKTPDQTDLINSTASKPLHFLLQSKITECFGANVHLPMKEWE